ncbi:MAG: aldehyde dehydrogenase [Bacilli bacterium]
MEIQKIVQSARDYYNNGKTREVDERIKHLKLLKLSISKNENKILEALKRDLNKSDFEGFMTELALLYEEINYICKHLKKWARPKKVKTPITHFPSKSYIHSEPYGVVLIMSPWNYPFYLSMAPLIGAIASGNTVILKPSNYSSQTSLIINRIISEVFKEEYVSVVLGGREENQELLNQKFDYIFFTGSPNVGKIVMESASKNLTPVSLELGGKSPCIIDSSADINIAAKRIAWGKFVNSGQTCVAPDYVVIHESRKEEFITKIIDNIEKFYSKSFDNDEFPKIITNRHFQRLVDLIANEKVIYGGNTKNNSIHPTLVESNWKSKIMEEEIFGPILPIITYKDLDETINQIKIKERPLALYLFTNDKNVEEKIVNQINYGGGCINDVIVHLATPYMPFGGVGNSGMGNYHGKFSFDTFSHKKSILKKANWLDINLRYPPYNKSIKVLKKFFK